ncbi:salicylate hydroxylase [Annulohypoxylon truncatum]|uniref:salicylate hydroxylase n=1 Tax=Annulohypoxylon truncatum TaxID=327061 RepID=UPI002007E523|nr:salicylate hydroxylase [Annulohypoxylon truncatum]KAI1213245.1 salicylate hydroxylase [Annulohypoxylon truncatum]
MTHNQLRVAIIGGGLAGAALANALVRVSRVDVHVFESATEFSERGAAVGLAKNAQLALAQIVPSASVLLKKAGAVPMNSSRIILGSGPEAGNIVFDLAADDPGMNVHRASLLRELLAPLPIEALHPNKKLITINANGSGVGITFQDGTVFQFDAVIGADGIFSTVREHVLQSVAATEQSSPLPAGFWDCRNVVPFEKAKATLGEKYFDVDRQYGWVGDGAFIMHDVLENRTMVQCVVSSIEKDSSTSRDRKRPLTREILTETLGSWMGGPIADGMISLICDQPDPCGYSQWEHKSTPTYANERVCLVGDAAHATTPWQGSGAGLAIEDAMILGTLFANISSSEEISSAFKAYDLLRRPRCQQVIDSSRETGQILCGQVDLHANELRGLLAPKWNFIFGLDMELHKREALDELRKIQEAD